MAHFYVPPLSDTANACYAGYIYSSLFAMENVPTTPMDDKEKMLGAISYLGPLCIVSFLMANNSKFVMFHAKQGLILLLAAVIVRIAIGAIFPLMGAWSLMSIVNIVILVAVVAGIIKAMQGEMWKMPVISAIAEKLNF